MVVSRSAGSFRRAADCCEMSDRAFTAAFSAGFLLALSVRSVFMPASPACSCWTSAASVFASAASVAKVVCRLRSVSNWARDWAACDCQYALRAARREAFARLTSSIAVRTRGSQGSIRVTRVSSALASVNQSAVSLSAVGAADGCCASAVAASIPPKTMYALTTDRGMRTIVERLRKLGAGCQSFG